MNFNIGKLYFSASPEAFWISIVALVIIFGLCVFAVTRSLRKKRAIVLESLRFLCACVIALILWSPQFKEFKTPEGDPTIVILYDESHSMNTVDAKVASIFGETGTPSIISRKEWLEFALNDKLWRGFETAEEHVKIHRVPFSTDDATLTKNRTGSDYYTAVDRALEENDNLKAIILLGDGDYNTGKSPSAAAQKAQINQVPIYTVAIGKDVYLPDLEIISLSAPKYGIVKEAIQIPFSIRSSIGRDIKTAVTLLDKKTNKKETLQITIPANSIYNDSILWRLDQEKTYDFSFSVQKHNSEVIASNNKQDFTLLAKKENIKVLVIESTPRWEYRFIRNALSRDPGVDLDCLLLHPTLGKGNGPDYIQEFPEDLAEFQKYDVIFLGDIGIGPEQLTVEQCNLIKGLVEQQASGLVFIPGSKGNIFSLLAPHPDDPTRSITELADLIPVTLNPKEQKGHSTRVASPLTLTDNGRGSLLTMLGDSSDQNAKIWRNLPGFNWYAPVIKAKPGSEVLAVHSSKRTENNLRMPLLVTQTFGTGKVLFLGHDSAWKWRKGVEDLYHYRFWGQVARWMSYKRNRAAGENLRLHFSKDKPKPGDIITVKANAFDENGAPLGTDGQVTLKLTNPEGAEKTLTLEREDGDWGAYFTRFPILSSGNYTIEASIVGAEDKAVTTTLETLSTEIEKIGQPANFDALKEMANITQGEFITGEQIPDLSAKINNRPHKEPRSINTNLRSDLDKSNWPFYLLGLLLVLLSLFWMGRKINGTF